MFSSQLHCNFSLIPVFNKCDDCLNENRNVQLWNLNFILYYSIFCVQYTSKFSFKKIAVKINLTQKLKKGRNKCLISIALTFIIHCNNSFLLNCLSTLLDYFVGSHFLAGHLAIMTHLVVSMPSNLWARPWAG